MKTFLRNALTQAIQMNNMDEIRRVLRTVKELNGLAMWSLEKNLIWTIKILGTNEKPDPKTDLCYESIFVDEFNNVKGLVHTNIHVEDISC